MVAPRHMQVQQGILDYIISEELSIGSILPSQNEFAKKFNTSFLTVRRALDNLEKNNIITRKHGSGTFVAAHFNTFPSRGKITFLNVDNQKEEILNFEHGNTFRGALIETFDRYHYSCDFLSCGSCPSGNAIHKLKDSVGILITGYLNDEWINLLKSLNIPTVVMGSMGSDNQPFAMVEYDWRKMTIMLGRHWLNNGAKKVGLITGTVEYGAAIVMREGFRYLMNTYSDGYDSSNVFLASEEYHTQDLWDFLDKNSDFDTLLVEAGFYSATVGYLWEKQQSMNIGLLRTDRTPQRLPKHVVSAGFNEDIWPCAAMTMIEQIAAGTEPVADIKIKPLLNK